MARQQPSGGGQTAQGQQQQTKGQGPVYKNESDQYFEVDDDKTESVNKEQTIMLDDKETAIHIGKDKKVYLGGLPSKGHRFAAVMTAEGPSLNVFARIP